MSGGGVHVQEKVGLLPVPHLRAHLSDRHHVLDQFLDQARGRASPGNPGSDLPANPLYPARQQSEVSTSCLLHQGMKYVFPLSVISSYEICSLTKIKAKLAELYMIYQM